VLCRKDVEPSTRIEWKNWFLWNHSWAAPPPFTKTCVRHLVGHVQSLDARFFLNQGVSDFALQDIRKLFKTNFFGNQIEKKSVTRGYTLLDAFESAPTESDEV
jgi:hypothetical protein